MSEDAKIVRN